MGLLSLPNEILLLIAESLLYSWDVSVLSQINRRLYGLLNAYVYQHIIQYFDGYVLSWAAQHGSEIVARRMLDEGAQFILSRQSPDCSTMALCVKHGNEAVLKLFLERGIMDISLVAHWNDPLDNPLICAVEEGHESVVRLLIAYGWQPDSALSIHAACAGHLAVLRLIMEAQSDPNYIDPEDGQTPLTSAVDGGHLAVVQYLLQAGADPNSSEGYPLARAAELGHFAVVQYLIQAGANPNSYESYPLACAAELGHLEMVRFLLEHAADANRTPDGLEGLPLYIAVKCLQTAVANLLFEWTDFNKLLTCGYSRGSLLCIAAACGSDIHVLQLLENGLPEEPKLEVKKDLDELFESLNPLQLAARMGHEHIVKLLLERSTTTDRPMGLMEAAIESGKTSLVQMLLENGFKIKDLPDMCYSWKRESLLFSTLYGGPEYVVQKAMYLKAPSMLKRLMDLQFIPYSDRHCIEEELPNDLCRLACAASKNDDYHAEAEATIDVLLSHGVGIDCETRWGRTPLSLYCDNEYDARPVKLLLEKGALPLRDDEDLETPLSLAVSGNMGKDGIRYLLQAISPHFASRNELEEDLAKCEAKAVRLKKWNNVMMLQRFRARLESGPWGDEDCYDSD